MDMSALWDTPNGRVIEAVWDNMVRKLLSDRTSEGNAVHVWMKHDVIDTCTQNLDLQNKVKLN